MRRGNGIAWAIGLLALAACGGEWTVADGVATRSAWVKARGIDGFTLDLYAPASASGAPAGLHPGVVLAPGGFVAKERYGWLARALAAKGRVVAVPDFPIQLGLLSADNAEVARRALVEGLPDGSVAALAPANDVAIGGHSLGGVVATTIAMDGGYAAIVLLASVPAGYDLVEDLKIPVLSLAGSNDCSIVPADVRAGAKRFSQVLFGEIGGLTHYGFTDALTEDVEGGCKSALELEAGHALVADVVDTFLAARVERSPEATTRLAAGWSGLTLTDRP